MNTSTPPSWLLQAVRPTLAAMLKRVSRQWMRPPKVPTRQWLVEYFHLPPEGADLPGAYNPDYVPYLWGIFHALDDSQVKMVVMQKAAQIGWTFGLVGYIGKRIHTDPCPVIIVF
ncbi:MAG: Phage terminase large subunit (GpA) [Candidatus Kentron sp. G]|nr:MAG: Phage terminase large subunit (GpA) [Candidatus Kentron sp. G]VFM98194.1 MAG: Phage terminase large subunit (GpA) [Candidatus Kentron sp. G]VFN00164.1 MAG: Phage terminase large subunit (GpA) [Candidatus Kentron sp. G]